jgi:hemerythrin-like domain-containing protein
MPDTILLLRLEHTNMNSLLDLVDEQLVKLERNSTLDYGVLRSILDYFSSYPDQCHHPKEELVFRKLQSRCPAALRAIDLTRQHEQLIRTTERFALALSDLPEHVDASLKLLKNLMREFVAHNRDHMAMEEEHFFPLALRTLSQHDWEEIEFDLFDRADPLFDRSAEDRFRDLRDKVAGFVYPNESNGENA